MSSNYEHSDSFVAQGGVGFQDLQADVRVQNSSTRRVQNASEDYDRRQVRNKRNRDRRRKVRQGAAIGFFTGA